MSQENVELVRRIWEASERRDTAAVFALYDPAIVWDFSHAAPVELRGLYHGYDGLRQFFRQWLEPFENSTWRPRHLLTQEIASSWVTGKVAAARRAE